MNGWTNECPPVFYRTLSPSGPPSKEMQKTNNTYPTTFLSRGHAYSELFSDISSYSELFFQCLNMFHHTPRERDRLIEPKTNK